MPVTSLYSQLFFCLRFAHAFLDTMIDTRSISDDHRWSRISLCLCDGLHCLVEICAHGNLCHIYISIAHGNAGQVFLLHFLAACCKLGNRTCRGSFGRLSACVGVHFCIKYHDIDIFSAGKYMVQTAESYIVRPAVTAKDPLGFFTQEVFLFQNLLCFLTAACFQGCNQFFCGQSVDGTVLISIQPFFRCRFHILIGSVGSNAFQFRLQSAADCVLSQKHTISKLCRIFKERIGPCRTSALGIHGIRSRR